MCLYSFQQHFPSVLQEFVIKFGILINILFFDKTLRRMEGEPIEASNEQSVTPFPIETVIPEEYTSNQQHRQERSPLLLPSSLLEPPIRKHSHLSTGSAPRIKFKIGRPL
jgi:hypothetical protein